MLRTVQAIILIKDERKARLSDFGLSNLVVGTQGSFFTSSTVGGSPRWAAPELYYVEDDEEHTPVISKPYEDSPLELSCSG